MKIRFFMKKVSLYIFSLIFVACSACLGASFLTADKAFAATYSSPQTFDGVIKSHGYDETTVVNNNLFFINFQGETNTLLVENELYGEYPYKIIEDTYNNSEYSVKNYFETTSNGKLSLKTNIIYNGEVGTPFTLNYTRSHFITGSGTTPQLISAIWNAVSEAFTLYAKSYDLDVNDDGFVDSITFLLTADPQERKVEWNTPLWPHSSTITLSSSVVDSSGQSLKLGKYNLATVEIEDYDESNNVARDPIEDSNGIKIAESSTYAHELSHVLGLSDYYIYDTMYSNTASDSEEVPVGLWDLMAYNYYQMPQHSLAYNKLQMGYIEDSNVIEIEENNTYELYPTSYWENNQITNNDVAAYYIQGQGEYSDQYFYIEYRKNDGLFDDKLPTSGLVVYRVDTGVTNSTYGGVFPGNYMAPPYSIQIMRNEVSSTNSQYLDYFGREYCAVYYANNGRNFSYVSPKSSKALANMVATGSGVGLSKIGNKIGASPTIETKHTFCYNTLIDFTWQTGDITYQVYSGSNQASISPSNVSYVNTGITIEVTGTTSDGKIQFKVDWDNLPDPETKEPATLIPASYFEDINLYNKLLSILSSYRGTTVQEIYSNDFKNFNVLDLSNANITSLAGLENLDLSNITIINLMQNSLENEDVIVLNSMAESLPKLQYVNFNLNNLQILGLNSTIRGNTKYIFGFQNYDGNLSQTEYYFSTDAQTNILSYYFNDDSMLRTSFGTSFVDIYNNTTTPGYYEYNVRFTNSNIGTSFTISFYIIDVKVQHVNIERNSAFTHGVVVSGIKEGEYSITTGAVSTITEVQNATVTYRLTIRNNASVYRTFSGTYSVVDTQAPIISSALTESENNIIIGQTFEISSLTYVITDNGLTDSSYTLKAGNLSSSDRKVVSYIIQKNIDGTWTTVSNIITTTINDEYRIVLRAVDNSGNVSEEIYIHYIIVPSSVLEENDFASSTLYSKLLAIAETNGSLILYPEVFMGVDFIDISGLGLTSLKDLEYFKFDSSTIIDAADNNLTSTSSIQNFIDSNVTILLLFNDIEEQPLTDNFIYGIQSLKDKFINERPEVGKNIIINEDYAEYFDYTITKDVSSSHGMSMLSADLNAFQEYGTYTITFTYKEDASITHTKKVEYGNISLSNEEYTLEAGLPFVRDSVIIEGLDSTDFYIEVSGAPQGALDLGSFDVTYSIYEKEDNEKVLDLVQTAIVQDTIAPEITIIGREEIYVFLGDNFMDQGVRAIDSYEGEDVEVIVDSTVNTSNIGEYTVTYKAKDSSGNLSPEITRIVNVIYYPIRGINVKLETSLYTGSTTTFEISPIVPENKLSYIDPNLNYVVYINDEEVSLNSGSYTFNKAGTYKLEVKAMTTDSLGNSRVVTSDTYTIVVKDMAFLEKYGAYLIGGMAAFIVIALVVYFVCSRRRDKII